MPLIYVKHIIIYYIDGDGNGELEGAAHAACVDLGRRTGSQKLKGIKNNSYRREG